MARIRTIKPEFWRHEELSSLPEATHLLAAALLNYADDEGYFNANPKLIQSECYPLRDPSVSVHDSLMQLASIDYLKLGKGADGRTYGHIIKFLEHQVINRPKESKIKDVEIVWEASCINHGAISDASPPERKGKEQGTGKGIGAVAPNGAYAFMGKVIRLKQSDFDRWQGANPHIELPSYLEARDAYLASLPEPERERWFVSTSADLRNKNLKAKQSGPPGDTDMFGRAMEEF